MFGLIAGVKGIIISNHTVFPQHTIVTKLVKNFHIFGNDITVSNTVPPLEIILRKVNLVFTLYFHKTLFHTNSPPTLRLPNDFDHCTFLTDTGIFKMIVGGLTTCHTQYT